MQEGLVVMIWLLDEPFNLLCEIDDYESFGTNLQLSVDEADPIDLRYDQVVLRFDLDNRVLSSKILNGIADVVVPVLAKRSTIYEISLVKINMQLGIFNKYEPAEDIKVDNS